MEDQILTQYVMTVYESGRIDLQEINKSAIIKEREKVKNITEEMKLDLNLNMDINSVLKLPHIFEYLNEECSSKVIQICMVLKGVFSFTKEKEITNDTLKNLLNRCINLSAKELDITSQTVRDKLFRKNDLTTEQFVELLFKKIKDNDKELENLLIDKLKLNVESYITDYWLIRLTFYIY